MDTRNTRVRRERSFRKGSREGLTDGAYEKNYYTISALVKRWGVSASTIIRLIEEGELRGLKIRGVYRVDLASVVNYERKVSF
ncbi:hypothetical protein MNBD_NITROSPINAE02-803 [hydrothermal vent metagenome]|uniref:Uncharacterized protein n=1 Tax=hydrothermal vent metagenome TaxID=652676 RepID=A0A3B1C4Z8_9ZZZZ